MAKSRLHFQCSGYWMTFNHPSHEEEPHGSRRQSRRLFNGCSVWLRALLLAIAVLWGVTNTHSAHAQAPACAWEAAPSEQLGQPFRAVQLSGIFVLGLDADGKHDRVVDMLKDFAFEIDCYGHVPNGNRSYYLSRSQPPFFSSMVDLIAKRDGDGAYLTYLPELRREYEYWMDGAVIVAPGQGYRHVVRLLDGTILNRFWDDRAEPRDESYREDVETARSVHRDPGEVFRSLRAETETGWDFSSRWLGDGHSLNTNRTVQLLPVDLNCLLGHLEETLAKAYRLKGDEDRSSRFADLAAHRAASIRRLMWNETKQIYVDYDLERNQPVAAARQSRS